MGYAIAGRRVYCLADLRLTLRNLGKHRGFLHRARFSVGGGDQFFWHKQDERQDKGVGKVMAATQ